MAIEHISDTARWIAVYRAWETDRPDARFRDPLARRLAGEKGEAIVRNMRRGRASSWAMVVRTYVIDEIIVREVNNGVDTVINLAAGLDTRPYRLNLPKSIRWIEVDLPGILAYKEEVLKDEKPVCQLERVRLDLSNITARQLLFQDLNASTKKALVLTEGLLIYLPEEHVAGLAKDLHSESSFQFWLLDLTSPFLLKMLQNWYSKDLGGDIKMQFAPAEGPDYFRKFGWIPKEFRYMSVEGKKIDRTPSHAWLWRIFSLFMSREKRDGFLKNGLLLLERQ